MITQSEAPAPEVIVAEKLRTDLYVNYGLKGETSSGFTGETRESATQEKSIPKNKKIKNH